LDHNYNSFYEPVIHKPDVID